MICLIGVWEIFQGVLKKNIKPSMNRSSSQGTCYNLHSANEETVVRTQTPFMYGESRKREKEEWGGEKTWSYHQD